MLQQLAKTEDIQGILSFIKAIFQEAARLETYG